MELICGSTLPLSIPVTIELFQRSFQTGGKSIQDECEQYVDDRGPVMEGHAVLTSAGDLPCRKIIHAVGPMWKSGTCGEEDTLYDCVFSHILDLASRQSFSSVAIPAISSGVFGFPPATSASVIVEAVKNFLDEKSGMGPLSEIHLLDTRRQIGLAFAQAIIKHFKLDEPAVFKFPSLNPTVKPKAGSRSFQINCLKTD